MGVQENAGKSQTAQQVYKMNHKITLEKQVKSYHFKTISRILSLN